MRMDRYYITLDWNHLFPERENSSSCILKTEKQNFQELHNKMVASCWGTKLGHELGTKNIIGCQLPWLLQQQGCYLPYVKAYWKTKKIRLNITAEDRRILKYSPDYIEYPQN